MSGTDPWIQFCKAASRYEVRLEAGDLARSQGDLGDAVLGHLRRHIPPGLPWLKYPTKAFNIFSNFANISRSKGGHVD